MQQDNEWTFQNSIYWKQSIKINGLFDNDISRMQHLLKQSIKIDGLFDNDISRI
jgi:hypothetical protein